MVLKCRKKKSQRYSLMATVLEILLLSNVISLAWCQSPALTPSVGFLFTPVFKAICSLFPPDVYNFSQPLPALDINHPWARLSGLPSNPLITSLPFHLWVNSNTFPEFNTIFPMSCVLLFRVLPMPHPVHFLLAGWQCNQWCDFLTDF